MAIVDRNSAKTYFEQGDKPSENDFINLLDSVRFKNESVPAAAIGYGIDALTVSATTTWNVTDYLTASMTLTQNTTLAITNAKAGQFYAILVTQDATGSRTITLPAGSIAPWGASNAIPMSYAANAKNLLMFTYDGTNYWWAVKKEFSA